MALIDKASLLMVPSVYEDGTLYNVLPSGNKAPDETGSHNGYDQTRADFTFSRGSNLAATRVNSDGLIEKGRENLLTYSNDFSQWSNSGTTETSGQADKDGGTDAWLLTKSTADGYIYQDVSQSGVQTYSVYLKANALNWARVQLNGSGADKYAYFDLANGVIGGSGSGNIDENIESVGNGWYRCSIVADTTSTRVRIYPADGDNDVSGTSGSIYIQNAQLEAGLVATDYIETGATTATAGVLENTPRIDYSSGAGALLLEPQRTNLVAYSEYINSSVSSWSKFFDTIITNNDAISPDGTKNATKIACPSSGSARIDALASSVAAGTYTYSCYAKGDVSNLYLNVYQDSSSTTLSSTQISTLINGSDWTRIDVTFTSTATSTIRFIYNTLPNGEHFHLWGAQLEAGSHVSSYVPTYGSAATRGADDCQDAGNSDVINSTEGVLYVEASAIANDSTNKMIALSDASSQNHVRIYPTTTSNRITIAVKSGNVNQYVYHYDGLSDITENWKIAVKYKANDFATFVNGTKVDSSTSGSAPVGLNELQYNGGNSANPFYGDVKQTMVFDSALTDAECVTLTTL